MVTWNDDVPLMKMTRRESGSVSVCNHSYGNGRNDSGLLCLCDLFWVREALIWFEIWNENGIYLKSVSKSGKTCTSKILTERMSVRK